MCVADLFVLVGLRVLFVLFAMFDGCSVSWFRVECVCGVYLGQALAFVIGFRDVRCFFVCYC